MDETIAFATMLRISALEGIGSASSKEGVRE